MILKLPDRFCSRLAEVLDMPVTFFFNPDNLLPAELTHPYTSDDEHELLTTFRNIKQSQNKQIVISVSHMAAQAGAAR